MRVVALGVRAVQLLSALVVLGVSISLAQGQKYGGVPGRTGYNAAAGAIGTLAACVGVLGLFFESLPQLIVWAIDGVAALALAAGGIISAISLRGTNCNNANVKTVNNDLLNGGIDKEGNYPYYGYEGRIPQLEARCRSYTADTVFLFLGCIFTAAVLALTIMKGDRTRTRGTNSYV